MLKLQDCAIKIIEKKFKFIRKSYITHSSSAPSEYQT